MTSSAAPLIYIDLTQVEGEVVWNVAIRVDTATQPVFIAPQPYPSRDQALNDIAIVLGPHANVYVREAGKSPLALRLSDAVHAANITPLPETETG